VGGPNGVRCEISYSITSSARSRIDRGIVWPSALAVLAFTTNLYLISSRDRQLQRLDATKDPIPPARLFALDLWHYHGTEAVLAAAERLGPGSSSRVLEIGSGVGGPACYYIDKNSTLLTIGVITELQSRLPKTPGINRQR
jgi:hypothetical protein